MLRTEHVAAVWITVALLTGCSRAEQRQPAADSTRPALESAAPVDAVASRRMLDPALFADARTREAYAAARKYAAVLEHIYCYCHCKENLGHRALAECFESDHAANCDVCITEALIVARMTQEGRSPTQIQSAIDAFYRA